jgi:hypothetical protein
VDSPYGAVQSKLDGPLGEARRYHPGMFLVLGESGTVIGCEYSNLLDTCCLLHSPDSWFLEREEARVEQCLGVLPLGMNIHSSFAAVPRSYGSRV